MDILIFLSEFMVPLTVFYIVGFGILSGRPVFDDFLKGASEGMKTVAGILPTLIGLMAAVGILRESGFLEAAAKALRTPAGWLHIPVPLVPVVLVRLVSSSAATAAVGILRESGFLEAAAKALRTPAGWLHIPVPLVPVVLVRLVSSSAATGLILDIFKEYGPDSLIGNMVSIMMGCTETIFYTMSVYFMTAGIRKTRWTLPGALAATAAGIGASIVLAGSMA